MLCDLDPAAADLKIPAKNITVKLVRLANHP
jgi:hypothetical protein